MHVLRMDIANGRSRTYETNVQIIEEFAIYAIASGERSKLEEMRTILDQLEPMPREDWLQIIRVSGTYSKMGKHVNDFVLNNGARSSLVI